MDHHQAPAILLAALPAAFESVCLIRCADVGRTGPDLAEFDQKDAAARLAGLLTDLGFVASREVLAGGGRRSYHLQRVRVLEAQRRAAQRTMAVAWRQGRAALLHTEPVGASSRRAVLRGELADAALRAALLAGGRRRRAGQLCVRLRDPEMTAMLVRAARLNGVGAEVTSRPGCLAVTVAASAAGLLRAPSLRAAS